MRIVPVLLSLAVAVPAQSLAWDVPHRGALVYERTTTAFQVAPPPSRLRPETVIAGREAGGHTWRHYVCPTAGIPAGFETMGFDDGLWPQAKSAFGSDPAGDVRSPWRSRELLARSTIDLGRRKPKLVLLRIHHDDDVKLWWNGALVVDQPGVGHDRLVALEAEKLDAWLRGDNVFAARCTNTGGPGTLDLQVQLLHTLPPGVRTGAELIAALRAEQQAADRVRGDLFGDYRPPAMLLQGELDRDQAAVAMPPSDLREMAWFAAMNMSRGVTGGPLQLLAPRLYRLGDVQLKGRVGEVDGDGWQNVELTLSSPAELATGEDSKRFVDRHVRGFVAYGIDATLKVRRKVQMRGDKARVVAFDTVLAGRITPAGNGKETRAVIEQRETWTFREEQNGQDAAFRGRVSQAIAKGTARLRQQLEDVNVPDLRRQPDDAGNSFHSGRLALGLLALIKGGVATDDAVVQRGYDELRKRTLVDTYSVALGLMAIEALYSPQTEYSDLKAGVIQRPRKRTLPVADKALVERWTKVLLDNLDTRVDPAYLLRFNYTAGARFDHSVNQYGLLGMYSAHLCGVEIPPTRWEAAANHLIAAQSEARGKVDLELMDYRTLHRLELDPASPRTVVRVPTRAAGWAYEAAKDNGEWTPVPGSMTCAGLTGLTICQAALSEVPDLRRTRLFGDIQAARNAAFAWLALNLQVRFHPGSIERQQHWHYYYLYGLERAALLSGVAIIQDRDWYFEGSMVLVMTQSPDGSWPGELHPDAAIERNAMAILFLKQSTLPVLTGQ